MSGRVNGRGARRGSVGAAVDPFNDRFPDDTATFDDLADVFLGSTQELSPTDAMGIVTPGRDAPVQTRSSGAAGSRGAQSRGSAGLGKGGGGGGESRAAVIPVELLVLGNLPNLATVWGNQYLRDLARSEALPVASLRLQGGFASVELFEFGPGTGEPSLAGRVRTLEEAITAAASRASRWVLRVDGADELDYVDGRLVTRITFATGSDEAATISAYRMIKRMAARIEALSPTPALSLHVVVIGTNPESAQRTGEKLTSTAKAFLGRDVSYHTSAARIGATRPAVLYFNGRTDVRPQSLLETLQSGLSNAARATSSAGASAGGSPAPIREPDALADDVMLSEVAASLAATLPAAMSEAISAQELVGSNRPARGPGRIPPAAPAVVRAVSAAARSQSAVTPAVAYAPPVAPVARTSAVRSQVVAPTPEQTHAIASVPGASCATLVVPGPGALSRHLGSLLGLGLECPYAPGVEIACDPTGRVHVLTRFDQGSDETAMGQLMIAAEWAHAHGLLLSAAAPRLVNGAECTSGGEGVQAARIDPALAPAKHVFTSEPRKIRRLLETDVRVHLLTPVRVGESQTWFCTALN